MAVDPETIALLTNETEFTNSSAFDQLITLQNVTISTATLTNELDSVANLNSGVIIGICLAAILLLGVMRYAYLRNVARRNTARGCAASFFVCCCSCCAPKRRVKRDTIKIAPSDSATATTTTSETAIEISTQTQTHTKMQRLMIRALLVIEEERQKINASNTEKGDHFDDSSTSYNSGQLPVLYDEDVSKLASADNTAFDDDVYANQPSTSQSQPSSDVAAEAGTTATEDRTTLHLPASAQEAVERLQQADMFMDGPSGANHHAPSYRRAQQRHRQRLPRQSIVINAGRSKPIKEVDEEIELEGRVTMPVPHDVEEGEEKITFNTSSPVHRKVGVSSRETVDQLQSESDNAEVDRNKTKPDEPKRQQTTNRVSAPLTNGVIAHDDGPPRREYSNVSIDPKDTRSTIISMQDDRSTVVVHEDRTNHVSEVEVGNPTSSL